MQSEKEGNVTDTPRETRVLDAVVSLVDNLLDDFDVFDLLTELTERCADLLDIAAAGFLLADPLGQLRLLAATSAQTHELELFQLQAEEGPCLECYATGQPVSVADLRAANSRWPRFVPAALEAGVASVHAVPMRAAGIVLGSLGLFGTRPGELNEADLPGRADTGAYRVRGDSAGTPADALDGDTAAALCADPPHRRRAGQGLPACTPRCFRRRGIFAAAQVRAYPRRSPDRRCTAVDGGSEFPSGATGKDDRTGSRLTSPRLGAPHGLAD